MNKKLFIGSTVIAGSLFMSTNASANTINIQGVQITPQVQVVQSQSQTEQSFSNNRSQIVVSEQSMTVTRVQSKPVAIQSISQHVIDTFAMSQSNSSKQAGQLPVNVSIVAENAKTKQPWYNNHNYGNGVHAVNGKIQVNWGEAWNAVGRIVGESWAQAPASFAR